MANKKRHLKNEELDDSLRLIVKTSLIVLIGLVISSILGYVYRIIIARTFGPEVYGLFSLAFTIVNFFIAIVALGFSDGLLRFIPILRAKKKYDEINYLFKKTVKFYLVMGIIASLFLIIFSDFLSIQIFHKASLSIFIKIMSMTILLNLFISIFLSTLRSFENIEWFSFISNIFNNLSKVVIIGILILIGFSSGASVSTWSYVLASLLTLILSYIVCRYKISQIFNLSIKKDYPNLSKEFFNYSWPIMFYSLISTIFFAIDTFSLGYYKSAAEVGFYSAALPIAAIIGIVPNLFLQLFFPMINREYSKKNYRLIEQLSKQVTKWIFMFTLPIFILIFFFPGAALNILFGPQYLAAEDALRLLLLSSFISALFIVSTNLLSMLGKSKIILANIVSSSVLNLILNSILVPRPNILYFDNSNGLIGAALSTLISVLFFNLLFIIQAKKYLSFFPFRRKMILIIFISLIPTFILFYLRSLIAINIFSIIILSTLFILLYGFLLLISHSLDENDMMIIQSVWKKLKIIK